MNIENILNIGMKIDLLAGYLFVRCFCNEYISLKFLSITDVKVLVFGLVIDYSLPDLLVAFYILEILETFTAIVIFPNALINLVTHVIIFNCRNTPGLEEIAILNGV